MLTVYLLESMKEYARYYLKLYMANQKYSQSNQLRSGKSDGKPSTPLSATNSDRQSQKVGPGNLSLNSPDNVVGNLFHDLYCVSNCVPMDESGIWSILTDTLHYVKPEVDSSVTYSYDQRRHQNSKSMYFDAAFSNIPDDENIPVGQAYNSKKENVDAANYNVPNVPTY